MSSIILNPKVSNKILNNSHLLVKNLYTTIKTIPKNSNNNENLNVSFINKNELL